jgi:hypothetical protein
MNEWTIRMLIVRTASEQTLGLSRVRFGSLESYTAWDTKLGTKDRPIQHIYILNSDPLKRRKFTAVRAYTKARAGTNQIHSRTIGDALGFSGLIRAAKEKRKGYLFFRCSV